MSAARLLYVMGTGRSGSTILEIMCASNAAVFGAGEMHHLLRDGFIADKTCTCRNSFRECSVWSKVASDLEATEPEYRQQAEDCRTLEKHIGFARIVLGLVGRTRRERYSRLNRALLSSIQRATGAKVVIDSSKFAARALLLAGAIPDRFGAILLTRSPRAVLCSMEKPNSGEQEPRSTVYAFAYVLFVSLCCWIGRRKLGDRCIHVRYEDLRADPIAEITRIEQWSGCNLSETKRILLARGSFDPGHIVTGNRMRRERDITFRSEPGHETPARTAGVVAGIVLSAWYRLLGFESKR